jgi:membrane protease YdiL (CAAX protease family)
MAHEHSDRRIDALTYALGLTIGAVTLQHPSALVSVWQQHYASTGRITYATFTSTLVLAFALLIALPTARRSGLTFGSIRHCVGRTTAVTCLPILLAIVVYPRLPEQPFLGSPIAFWTISPIGQDLFFLGAIFGQLDRFFYAHVHRYIPVSRSLVITAVLFACWHLPNIASMMSPSYFVFQLGYTFCGYVLLGLSRQWTGSVLYATASHCAVNYFAANPP